ncbi:sigma-54 interaction domain-containing protein [Alkalicoccus urumqiensis]|uniref:Sigma-54-dependent Fis family transcriptional regulator n=1 Tax=Alkalicoccus urumqiensis TaxID=1548213 RepID=A0A2P6MDX4_ALKUR|nr:sigma 54-interacting transcriptional regulator [Alkalicoccus urumqiensis]PRO64482.1 sigma-54-dependent Fis family transcriptional regulator [Alkalicoccus urumqiensis]
MLSIIEKDQKRVLETLFGTMEHCIVMVDRAGCISYLNNSYCRFLGVQLDDVRGRHVTDVIENTRMHIVVDTGEEEMADLQQIRGDYMVAHRIPLKENDVTIGALGMVLFRDTDEWKVMNSRIKDLLLELETYKNRPRKESGAVYALHDIITSAPEMHRVKDQIRRVAPSDVSVLIRGESGTGKELFAHSVHRLSERSAGAFVKVNCAAIPEHLLEAELFGYQDGAFTGAKKGGKPGKFQLADGGTLFLDEIGDMPSHAQVKILRALQEGEVEAVGSTEPQKVDVRIIAATNRSLEEMIAEKTFREDLYYRINVVQLSIPPLRKRRSDILLLAHYLLRKTAERTGKRVVGFTDEVETQFAAYDWPGNVRELENVIEAAVHMTAEETIPAAALPVTLGHSSVSMPEGDTLKERLAHAEKQILADALRETKEDKQAAAGTLGISRSSLYEKISRHGL